MYTYFIIFTLCLMFCQSMTANVLELCLVRFETFSYRNITDKDTMFVAICKAKIIVPAKRPLLQMLCCPPALGKGAVITSGVFKSILFRISFPKSFRQSNI